MQVIDGKLYPPMAAKVDGSLVEPIRLGEWEKAVERPDLAVASKDKDGNTVYHFGLNKGWQECSRQVYRISSGTLQSLLALISFTSQRPVQVSMGET